MRRLEGAPPRFGQRGRPATHGTGLRDAALDPVEGPTLADLVAARAARLERLVSDRVIHGADSLRLRTDVAAHEAQAFQACVAGLKPGPTNATPGGTAPVAAQAFRTARQG